jgi:hypothetical protein
MPIAGQPSFMIAADKRFCWRIWSVSTTKKVDSNLASWDEIKDQFHHGGILIGNGASLAVWENFAYRSLYEKASSQTVHALTSDDKSLFSSLNTENFEQVLGALSTAKMVQDGNRHH